MPVSINETPTRRASVPKGPENFSYIGGRRYHNDPDSPYMFPNDQQEHDRMRKSHLISKYMLQKNYSAPVEDVLRGNAQVLDIGCGPGLWCIEMAVDFPKSQFTGVDISNVFPVDDLPPNVSFNQANALKLPFPDAKFDYVFMRQVSNGITTAQWPLVLQELGRVLKPGGFLELNEPELMFECMGPVTTKIHKKLTAKFSEVDIDITLSNHLHRMILKAGNFDVFHTFAVDVPVGDVWKTDIATLVGEDINAMYSALKPWLSDKLGTSEEEYECEAEMMRKEWNEEFKTSYRNRVVVARKM